MDEFPPGRVPLLLLIFALASGSIVAVRSVVPRVPALSVWVFTHVAYDEHGHRLKDHPDRSEIELRNLGNAMFDRLSLAVMSDKGLPDLVEIEQSVIGRFLRGPVDEIPFVDLTDRIVGEGWDRKCVRARFARYSVQGRIFGIPHDLHPLVLVYRPDVLADLGFTPADLRLWSDWVDAAPKLYRPGALGTDEWRHGLSLSTVEAFDFLAMLWQRGGDIFRPDGTVMMDDDLAIDTLEFYVSLLRGDPPAAGPELSSWTEDFAAVARGQIVALPCPDWMLATIQLDARSLLEGKVKCMPMPAWKEGGPRTASMGGTAMCIPQGCADVDRAWALVKFLYFDRDSLVERFRTQTIVPPLVTVFDDAAFDEQVDFFQGQRVGRLLTELALEVPPVQGSAYMPEAYALLNAVFADVLAGRVSPRDALERVATDLRDVIERDRRAIRAGKRSPEQE
jgi:arabinosaccharide transport system substrate-binding protein